MRGGCTNEYQYPVVHAPPQTLLVLVGLYYIWPTLDCKDMYVYTTISRATCNIAVLARNVSVVFVTLLQIRPPLHALLVCCDCNEPPRMRHIHLSIRLQSALYCQKITVSITCTYPLDHGEQPLRQILGFRNAHPQQSLRSSHPHITRVTMIVT